MIKHLITLLTLIALLAATQAFAAKPDLFKAIESGNLARVKQMIQTDKSLLHEKQRKSGNLPLHCAVKVGNLDMIKLLLDLGADPNKNDKSSISGCSPIYYAITGNREDIAQLLLERGARIYEQNDAGNLLVLATKYRCFALAQKLLKTGNFKINQKAQQGGLSALHYAVQAGNLDFVKLLVENGANVNLFGDNNRTPLHIAAEENFTDIAKFLVEKGANVNAYELEPVDRLSSSAGKYERKFANGALHYATQNGNLELVKLLVENGANANAFSCGENTPLHYAAYNGHDEIIRYLVSKGANINARGKIGKETPLKRAMKKKRKSTIALIKSLGGKK
ncbi:MAG: ankyrin repeat domain-containing protein [Candidatus Rifleibacteriota bacterium]